MAEVIEAVQAALYKVAESLAQPDLRDDALITKAEMKQWMSRALREVAQEISAGWLTT